MKYNLHKIVMRITSYHGDCQATLLDIKERPQLGANSRKIDQIVVPKFLVRKFANSAKLKFTNVKHRSTFYLEF